MKFSDILKFSLTRFFLSMIPLMMFYFSVIHGMFITSAFRMDFDNQMLKAAIDPGRFLLDLDASKLRTAAMLNRSAECLW